MKELFGATVRMRNLIYSTLASLLVAIAVVASAFIASGCTVYKSSDRDNFNSNGYNNSVKTQSLAPALKPKEAAACWTATDIKDFGLPAPIETPRIDSLPAGYRLFVSQVVTLSSESATTNPATEAGVMCTYFIARTIDGGMPPHLALFIQEGQAQVEQLALMLASNWQKRAL